MALTQVSPMLRLALLLLLLAAGCVAGRELNIKDFGVVANSDASDVGHANTKALNALLAEVQPGDTVLVAAGDTFYLFGGILGRGLSHFTFRVEGRLIAIDRPKEWPTDDTQYLDFITFDQCDHLTVTGKGTIDGRGVLWWDLAILGKLGPHERPKLVMIHQSTDILVEHILLHNSPFWTLTLRDVARAECSHVTVHTDRKQMQRVKDKKRALRLAANGGKREYPDWPLEPEDLNTDGIDPSGRDVWIHDCVIYNDDDSIAVKPCDRNCKNSDCTKNILIERTEMVGFGASIGSVPPHEAHNCVRNVTFRDITMPKTGKGVYVKSNPTCMPGRTGEISDITYERIKIVSPRWWAIWIGPQQQQEPHTKLGRKCSLFYPMDPHCPTQGCVTFKNILLKDIEITDPYFSPGVVLGNVTNPMQNIVFDNVQHNKPGWFPYGYYYRCVHVDMHSSHGTSPEPMCKL